MISREQANAIRRYINEGGEIYPGVCRAGSYWIHELHLDEEFPVEVTHG